MKILTLDAITEDMFNRRESGSMMMGVKYEYAGEGWSECYQYSSVAELVACARFAEQQPGMLRYKLVTHKKGYKSMKTLYEWERQGVAA